MTELRAPILDSAWPLVGVIHLRPLPGSPNWGGDLTAVREQARRDAAAYRSGGIDALIIENYGDVPFTRGAVPSATIAAMAVLIEAVKAEFGPQIGINVLRNDGLSALALAAATDARFIRVNVLVGAMVTDQGLIEGDAWNVQLARRHLAPQTRIWADVMVKHATPVGSPSLADLADDTMHRGGAATLILSGVGTGAPTNPADFLTVRQRVPSAPLIVGSGLTLETLPRLMAVADGAIVATSLKTEGQVDPAKVRALVDARQAHLARR